MLKLTLVPVIPLALVGSMKPPRGHLRERHGASGWVLLARTSWNCSHVIPMP